MIERMWEHSGMIARGRIAAERQARANSVRGVFSTSVFAVLMGGALCVATMWIGCNRSSNIAPAAEASPGGEATESLTPATGEAAGVVEGRRLAASALPANTSIAVLSHRFGDTVEPIFDLIGSSPHGSPLALGGRMGLAAVGVDPDAWAAFAVVTDRPIADASSYMIYVNVGLIDGADAELEALTASLPVPVSVGEASWHCTDSLHEVCAHRTTDGRLLALVVDRNNEGVPSRVDEAAIALVQFSDPASSLLAVEGVDALLVEAADTGTALALQQWVDADIVAATREALGVTATTAPRMHAYDPQTLGLFSSVHLNVAQRDDQQRVVEYRERVGQWPSQDCDPSKLSVLPDPVWFAVHVCADVALASELVYAAANVHLDDPEDIDTAFREHAYIPGVSSLAELADILSGEVFVGLGGTGEWDLWDGELPNGVIGVGVVDEERTSALLELFFAESIDEGYIERASFDGTPTLRTVVDDDYLAQIEFGVREAFVWIAIGEGGLSRYLGADAPAGDARALARYREVPYRTLVHLDIGQLAAVSPLVAPTLREVGVPHRIEVLLSGRSDLADPFMLNMLAATFIPAWVKYTQRTRTTEATMNLRRLFDSTVYHYYQTDGYDPSVADGFRFPESVGPTPPLSALVDACENHGGEIPPDPSWWEHATWRTLDFEISEPHRYIYEYTSSGEGNDAMFSISAYGDLDCDGTTSLFRRFGVVQNGEVQGSAGLYIENELE